MRKVPRMTRGHYQFIANVIGGLAFKKDHVDFIAEVFADKLAETNPRFNRQRFIKAVFDEYYVHNRKIDKVAA